MSLNAIFNINKTTEAVPKAFCILSNLALGWRLALKTVLCLDALPKTAPMQEALK